jgi:predicted metal-dependent hydrolase
MRVDEYMQLPRKAREEYLDSLAPRELLQFGVELFNARNFWHSHEAWEAAWIPSERPVRAFYQGLIQAAASFVHLTRNEYPGTEKLLVESLAKLDRYEPDYLAIEVARLVAEARQTLERVTEAGPRGLAAIDDLSLPYIVQQPQPASSRFETGDVALHWLEWPSEDGQQNDRLTVVLLHAPGLVARVWQPIAARLAGRYRVMAPDLPGHGGSAAGEDLQADIDAVDAWLEAVAPQARAIVSVGPSAGLAARLTPAVDHALEICLSPREAIGPIDGDVQEARRRVWDSRWEMFTKLHMPRWFAHWRADLLWTYVEEGTEVLPDGQVRLLCDDGVEQRLLGLGRPLDRLIELNVSPLARPVEAARRLQELLEANSAG